MGLWDAIGSMAGVKAIQSGADLRLLQHTHFDPTTIPAHMRVAMNDAIKQRFLNSEITEFDGALLKLSWIYRDTEQYGIEHAARFIYEAIEQLRAAPGAAFSPDVSLECIGMTGSGPDYAGFDSADDLGQAHEEEEEDLVRPLVCRSESPAPVGKSFDDAYAKNKERYDSGDIDGQEFLSTLKQTLSAEIDALLEARLKDAFGDWI